MELTTTTKKERLCSIPRHSKYYFGSRAFGAVAVLRMLMLVVHCGEVAPRLYSEERFCGAVDDLAPDPGQHVVDLVGEVLGAVYPDAVAVVVNVHIAMHWTHDNDQHLRYRTGLKTRIHHSIGLLLLLSLLLDSGIDCAVSANG